MINMNVVVLERLLADMEQTLDAYQQDHGDFVVCGMPYSEVRTRIPELLRGIAEGARRISASATLQEALSPSGNHHSPEGDRKPASSATSQESQ
jgi:hypothetical protein